MCVFLSISGTWEEMKQYKCYFCAFECDSLDGIVEHCKIHHNHKPLKYRHLLLNEQFRNFKFQTKTHSGIIPADLEKTGKELLVSNELVYIRDNKPKQKRLITPQKLPETSAKRSLFSMNNEQIVLDNDDDLHIDDIESENQDPNKEYVEYLCSLVPSVVEELREAG